MVKSNYNQGYYDGFRYKEWRHHHADMAAYLAYAEGYLKGKEDKDLCEAYSDEAMGVAGYI